MSAAIASAITPYGGVHTYLSCKQSYFLNPLVSSSVPELHLTQDSTDVPSELLRERGLYFLWSLPPHTRPRNRHTPEGKCRSFISGCLYTQPFTDNTYSCIYTYMYIQLYGHTATHAAPAVFFYIYFYLSFHFRF